MFGLNWVDIVVFALLVSSLFAGFKIGTLGQMIVSGMFFGTIFFCGWLYPKLLPIEDRGLLTVVNTNLVLVSALITGSLSVRLNSKVHFKLLDTGLKRFDGAIGAFIGLVSMAMLSWLLLSTLARMPFVALSNSVNSSSASSFISQTLPHAPAVFATFNNPVNPNNPPFMFYERAPESSFEYSTSVYKNSTASAAESIVMITGAGCGGIVTASGFAVGDGLIMTSAHVVAGLVSPTIKHSGQSYSARTVLFDPNLDLAILRINDSKRTFSAPSLELSKEILADDSTVSVIGYPSGRFTASPGILHENRQVYGRNIYDVGYYGRDVYIIQTYIETGVSGAPVIGPDGRVVGMVYSKLADHDDLAFALASPRLTGPLELARTKKISAGVGICVAN